MGAAEAIAVPVIALAALAAVLPRLLVLLLGRGWHAAVLNMALCAVLLTLVSGAYFAVMYVTSDARGAGMIGAPPMAALNRFLWLGLMSGLVWAPVTVLSLTAITLGGEGR